MKNIFKVILSVLLLTTLSYAKSVNAYFSAKNASLNSVKSKLKKAGFTILSTYEVFPGKNIVTVTNSNLKSSNTFVAAINIYLNGKDIRVQNPEYFGHAYLGKNYKEGEFGSTVNSLAKALGELRGTVDVLDDSKLSHYHFMFAMPYFEDTITVAKGNVKSKLSNPNILYKLTLPNGNILVGHKLSQNISSFPKKIGQEDNVALLPYQSMIRGNEAFIMAPKFYIALSYPLLKMSHFMKISSIPGMIEDDIKNQYK